MRALPGVYRALRKAFGIPVGFVLEPRHAAGFFAEFSNIALGGACAILAAGLQYALSGGPGMGGGARSGNHPGRCGGNYKILPAKNGVKSKNR